MPILRQAGAGYLRSSTSKEVACKAFKAAGMGTPRLSSRSFLTSSLRLHGAFAFRLASAAPRKVIQGRRYVSQSSLGTTTCASFRCNKSNRLLAPIHSLGRRENQ